MGAHYDTIGVDYAERRRPDPRIAATIHAALGENRSVLNVGAGTGSYEPAGPLITAVEPSAQMIRQRPVAPARVVQAYAEDLPFDDGTFDAAMAVLTVHHWADKAKGMAELRRVTRGRIAILTYDPAFRDFWLLDYFPNLATLDDDCMPPMTAYSDWLGPVEISPIPVPHDCTDGFLAAYWRRPKAYLDPRIRAAMSSFWRIGDIKPGLDLLEHDIDSGVWTDRYGRLLDLDSLDCGYRLVVARS
ncbi:MAG: class I SAM-dependent methyltransferase [Pseudomonadota bacterium]